MLFKVKAKFSLFSKKAKIKSKTQQFNGLKIKGDFLAWEFDIEKDKKALARISKKLLKLSDTYDVSVADEKNAVYYLAIAIIIDCMHHRQKGALDKLASMRR